MTARVASVASPDKLLTVSPLVGCNTKYLATLNGPARCQKQMKGAARRLLRLLLAEGNSANQKHRYRHIPSAQREKNLVLCPTLTARRKPGFALPC